MCQWSALTGQRPTWAGSKLGLDRARFGPVWAGLTQTRGILWCCHVVVVGHHWANVHGLRSTVDREALVHRLQTGLRWTESTLLLPGAVLVHRVHTRVASEGVFPCFSRGGAPTGGELAMSLRGGAGVQLGRGKAFLGHDDHDSGA